MNKYIDSEKLIALIDAKLKDLGLSGSVWVGRSVLQDLKNDIITSLQQEQPKFKVGDTIHKIGENTIFPMTIERIYDGDYVCVTEHQQSFINIKFQDDYELVEQEQPIDMIQWTGNNLKEVIDFTGKSPRFGEWFKSWEEYENYVHTHNDILKLFCEDGSHYEVPIGAWIVKTPDGYNVPSVAKYIQQVQPMVDLEKVWNWIDDTFRETEVNSRYGESRNVLMSDYDVLKSDLREKYERDLGFNARKEE